MISPTFIYFSKSSPTVLQFTTSAPIAQGPNNIVLATCEDVASGGTVTIETTTGVVHKNYYSMDALFDGAAYGRIAVGNLLSNNLNLGSGSLAGVLTLDKTADSTSGSGRKAVTTNEKTGADRGYNGFDTNSFLSKSHFLNDIGIAFQSHSGTSWAGMNSNGVIGINNNVLQFQISASTGAAGFGGNTGSEASPTYPCTLSSTGLTITDGAKIHVQTAGADNARITIDSDGIYGYASDNTTEFYITAGTGKAYFANGKIVADCGGLTLTSTGDTAQIKFYNEDPTPVLLSGMYSLGDTTIWAAADGKSLLIGDNNTGANHDTEVIKLASQYIEFSNVNQDYTTPYKYVFPIYSTSDYDNLSGKFLKATKGSSRVVHLSWDDAAGGHTHSSTLAIATAAITTTGAITASGDITCDDVIADDVRADDVFVSDGANASPSYTFTSGTGSGLRRYDTGGYEGVVLLGDGRFICAAISNGSIDYLWMDATLDMNSFDIIDCDDIICDDIDCDDIDCGDLTATGIVQTVYLNTDNVSSHLLPTLNGTFDLGSSTKIWEDLFYNNATEGSDVRIKTDIQDLTNANSLAFIDSLRPRSYKRLDNKGETIDSVNYGLVAQEVEEALTGLNIDKTKFSLINLPDTETITQVINPDGTEAEVPNPRGLRYTQLIAPLIGAVKELKARIEVLEGN